MRTLQAFPTIDHIEQAGKWISAKHSGTKGRIEYWKKTGLLVERDIKTVRVIVHRPVRGSFSKVVTFYRQSRLATLSKMDFRKSMVAKMKAIRTAKSAP